jgi:hypothetical protein
MNSEIAATAVPFFHQQTILTANKVMKLFSLLFAALVGTAVLAPVTASADSRCGERTRVTYDRCGNPIFWVYTFAGRDCHGCPIFRWVIQSRGHGDYGHGGYDRGGCGGYDRGGYDRDRGGYDRGGCDHGGHSGISFYWGR